ncbi:hypothetical protein AAFF_G00171330 [Aldrovandia affinis]|uniref:TERF1-interacting nuclear factor 2 N-terminal domain-containing protein n=1 Tax=Aldrovandia affinis TaxID=143900 RepID=A0AAD7SZQ4_9TELE|nr:hypothetical protein AAFF_G00171330 [Aldrovandia affinis]
METRRISQNTDPSPPLSSLRLLVPPLRLISAAMWQVAQRRDVMDYGKLEEFVTLVTETVPELLTYRQRAQLILGLRARLILELCRGEQPADLQTIQPKLDRMCPSAETPTDTEVNDAEVEASEANFLELVQTLLKDPAEREHFFQEVFPVDYGPKYDAALQMLVWEFLSRLEHLLPVPDLTQTVSWLSDAPSGLEDCVQPVCHPQQLKSLLQHFRCRGHLDMQETRPTATDDSILSSLSTPPCPRVVMSTEHTEHCAQSEPVHDSINFSGPTTVGEEVVIESMVETMYCTVELDTGLDRSEHSERETQNSLGNTQEEASNLLGEEESAVSESDRREMSRGLQRQSEGREGGWRDEEHMGSRTEQENQRDELMHGDKTIKTTQVDRDLEDGGKSRCDQQEGSLVASSLHQQPSVCIHRLTDPCNPHHTANTEDQRGETLLQKQKETDDCAVMPEKQQPESSQKGNCAKATNESSFSPQKKKTGHTDEVVTKVFACSKKPQAGSAQLPHP